MESVRVQLSGNRIKANGRIVAAAVGTTPAFGAYYDLQTDEAGAAKRFGLTVTLAERERQLAIARDEENMWLVTDQRGEARAAFDGALDVDVVFSPFFNTFPIRRHGLHVGPGSVTVPVIYVSLPDVSLTSAMVRYSSAGWRTAGEAGSAVEVHSPVAKTTIVIDAEGFIVDYPGLAARI
jgi:hypothetical protein